MILSITRTDEDGPYDLVLEVDYEQGEYVPPYLWGTEIEDHGEVVLTCAWDVDGHVVALTDAEINELEQRIFEKLEMMG